MAKIAVPLALGIGEPAKLGTVYLKQTSPSALAYAQNIDINNDEYGPRVARPGPAYVTITNNSELTGVVSASALYAVESTGYLWFIEGILGATNKLRKVENVVDGGSMQIDTDNLTVTDSGHANVVLTDILIRNVTGTYSGYVFGKDDTDGWVKTFGPSNSGAPSITATQALSAFNTGRHPKGIVGADNKIYIGHGYHIDNINTSEVYANDVITLKNDLGVTAFAKWRLNLVVAFNDNFPHTFATRKGAGRAGLVLWDYTPNTSWSTDYIPCPSRYISAVKETPTGNLICFGGVDEGRSTLWEFTGYGFNKIVSYIGDLPYSNHSVDFDGQGRVIWHTADGYTLRFSFQTGELEHIGSILPPNSGGFLRRAIGGSGNEFLASSGQSTGPIYSLKRITFGAYRGDLDSGADDSTTPLVISGPVNFPTKATINNIELQLDRALVSGDNIELRLYKNGNTTPINYGDDINSTADGTVASSVRREQGEVDVFLAHIGVAFKTTDERTTSPGAIQAIIDYDESE